MQHLLDLTLEEFRQACEDHERKPYLADQVLGWIYRQGVTDFAAMTNVSKADRTWLQSEFEVSIRLSVGDGDGTARLWTCDLTAEYVRLNADYRT